MKITRLVVLSLPLLLGLAGCNGGGSEEQSSAEPVVEQAITSVRIGQQFYPRDLETTLQANLNYFVDGIGVSSQAYVPYDHVLVNGTQITPSSYTNISTIALYINVLIEMIDAGDEQAIMRLARVLTQLEAAPKWNGLFYWLYQIQGHQLAINQSAIASSVDNGIMSFTLAGLVGALSHRSDERLNRIAVQAQAMLDRQRDGWVALYDGAKGLMRAGWSKASNDLLGYYIDRKSNESRLATLWAVLNSDGRIPPSAFEDMLLLTGEVNVSGTKVTALLTWDGSYFQALLPSLWLNEQALIPDYTMIDGFSRVHAAYADTHGIPFASASATINNGYKAYGVATVSESHRKYGNAIETGTTGSPHTLALYYLINPSDATHRLNQVKRTWPKIETVAGWVDAIDHLGQMSSKVIGLDQGMFVGAFIARSVRNNVQTYINSKGHQSSLSLMYRDFVADEHLAVVP